jgi:hypothetical protein
MDRRTAGVYGALCGGLLGLVVIAACSQPVTGDPEDVSPGQPETSATETGGDTIISIPTVVPPTQDSKPTESDDCPLPGRCATTEPEETLTTSPSTTPPPETGTFTTVPPPSG